MNIFVNKIVNILRDKWIILLAWNICIGLFFYAYGCESTTSSLIDPTQRVNLDRLQSELDFLVSKYETGLADIERQNKFRQAILNQTLIIAESGTINPVGLITTALAIFGIGATADDVRLRKKIKNAK